MVKLSLSKTMLARDVFRKKHLLVLLGFLLISSFTVCAQTKIEGLVVDERTNEPLIGATVLIKSTSEGAVTTYEGKFVLSTKTKLPLTLSVSLMGYKSLEITVYETEEILLIGMIEDLNLLNEVVVVAYGTQKRGNITAAISSVKSEDMANIPATSIEQAMQGKMAGVQIAGSSGSPGSASSVNIRGVSSISAGNEPLWVIDGMPVNSEDHSWAGGQGAMISPLAEINPADIESVEVLKDASAAALYGSRATNGVILVTTKRGRVQKTKVSLDFYTGLQNLGKKLEFLDSNSWVNAMNEAVGNYNTSMGYVPGDGGYLDNYSLYAQGVNTKWFDEVTRSNAMQTSVQLAMSGGNEKTKFYLSGGYFSQEGIEKKTLFTRYSLRSNLDHQFNERVKISSNISLSYVDHDRITSGNNIYSPWSNSMTARPDYPVYNADGSYSIPNVSNPVHCLLEPEQVTEVYRALINLKGTVKILEGLNYNINLGGDYSIIKDFMYYPITSLDNQGTGRSRDYRTFVINHLMEHTLDYSRAFGKLNFNALLGYSYQSKEINYNGAEGTGFISNALKYVAAGATRTGTSAMNKNALQSLFGRVNFGYDDRYLLEFSLRSDASSKFAKDNRTGYFPAGSIGWRPSNESFFPHNDVLTDLKIRGSVGLTGNQEGIGSYEFYNVYASGYNYNGQPGLAFGSTMNNSDLTWEKTLQYGVGLDMEFWRGRIALSVDLFKKDTRDLLLSHDINGVTGFSSTTSNIGTLTNKGLELMIRSDNLSKGTLKWNTTFNISFIRNEITELTKDAEGNSVPKDIGFINRLAVGQPISVFYLIKALGVYQSKEEILASPKGQDLWDKGIRPGDMKYYDKDENGLFNDSDREYVGNPFPKFYGSLINSFSYKGFDLSIDLQYSYGAEIYANWKQGTGAGHLGHIANSILKSEWDDRWTPENPNNSTPRAVATGTASAHNVIRSSRFLEDASFLRIRNVTLGYELPSNILKKIMLERVRLYVTANNLYNFTKYSGFDPEVTLWPEDASYRGYDAAIVPQLRSFIFGVNLSF